ncbi:leucine-rich_repeat domain-containing protein [Hexamita inflata]|uniref:Leucine-rich repeat domain-containing protein n=1 Tax=Hexamita inflata TaxID=28002 RepID=A0AA86NJH3_9EUKA|nr:leucine-rich repeat domain-containing protein [Hexamita inflata]
MKTETGPSPRGPYVTQDELLNYLGQCTKQQLDTEFQAVQEQVKQRDNMPQYQYLIQMIQKYENEIQLKTWITVFNVSKNESNQILNIKYQTQNCELNKFGRNVRIECNQKDHEIVLNKIKNINATFKVKVEEFRLLFMFGSEVENISTVNLSNIQKLFLNCCKNVKFHGVANVKVLHAKSCDIQSIDGIQNWNQLLELNLTGNKLKSVAQLENLTQLKVLELTSNQNIKNVEPLRGLVNLTTLSLQYNKIENVEPLRGLVNLRDLYLSSNQIENVEPLRGLVNLTDLSLQYNKIENVEPLRGLVNLTTLSLHENKIQNVEPLRGLVNLTDLSLYQNQIENVEPLRGLVNLTTLSLQYNKIENVEPLRGLVNLTTLSLSSNQIQNVEPLRGLVNLTYLSLSGNQIQNVEPLRGLVNLRDLYLSENQIQNVEPLRGLVNLTTLDLQNNQIKDFSPIQNHPNFKYYLTFGQK